MEYTLMLVEAGEVLETSIYTHLANNGHAITKIDNCGHLQQELSQCWPDLVIFNLLVGAIAFETAMETLTATNLNIPCLVVTNQLLPQNITVDCVLHPPYTLAELKEQIATTIHPKRFIRLGKVVIDTVNRGLLREGVAYHLTRKQFGLLMLLLETPGKLIYRQTIMQQVWQTDYMGDTRTLDVHVRWLREKIEDNPSHPKHLLTIRGAGYRFITRPK